MELVQTAPSRSQQREALLGVFPISGTLPVIAEEDEDQLEGSSTSDVIDLEAEATPKSNHKVPE